MTCFRAAWIVPIDGPPLPDAELVVEAGRIVETRPAGRGAAVDFGSAILLPGLVNAHTHLELTALRGLVEDLDFFPWIRTLTDYIRAMPDELFLEGARLGAWELLSGGVTAIGECCFNGGAAQAMAEFGLGGRAYGELFAPRLPVDFDAIWTATEQKLERMRERSGGRVEIAVSPHATYTVRPEMLERLAARPGPYAIHCAESKAETEFIRDAEGPIAGVYADSDAWQVSPTRYLAQTGILRPETLLIHCVQLEEGDADLIAQTGAAVATCPKSNAKLGAGGAPIADLLERGVRVGLGTDSALSNNRLDLFEEMRALVFADRLRNGQVGRLGAKEAIFAATLGGAEALGIQQERGSLSPGKRADFCVVSLDRPGVRSAGSPEAALVYGACAADVEAVFLAGQRVEPALNGADQRAMRAVRALVNEVTSG